MGGLAYRLLDRQEKMIYHQAVALTTISAGFRQRLIGKGVSGSKVTVIPNWANEQYFRPVAPDESIAVREGLAGRFNIIYGGNIGTAQGLKVVLDAAELLRDLPAVQFVMIGDGVERESLAREGTERGINNLRFPGSRPPEQMASYYALASALLLPLKRDPAYELTIPSKTYAYLASGRPVLAAATGEVAALIDELNAGVVCDPEDPGALALAVRTLFNMSAPQREALGDAGRQAFVKRFRRQVLCDRYEELFAGIAPAPSLGVR